MRTVEKKEKSRESWEQGRKMRTPIWIQVSTNVCPYVTHDQGLADRVILQALLRNGNTDMVSKKVLCESGVSN